MVPSGANSVGETGQEMARLLSRQSASCCRYRPWISHGRLLWIWSKVLGKVSERLYINDWSYGKLYAVHLRPDGAAYSAHVDTSSPAPLFL